MSAVKRVAGIQAQNLRRSRWTSPVRAQFGVCQSPADSRVQRAACHRRSAGQLCAIHQTVGVPAPDPTQPEPEPLSAMPNTLFASDTDS